MDKHLQPRGGGGIYFLNYKWVYTFRKKGRVADTSSAKQADTHENGEGILLYLQFYFTILRNLPTEFAKVYKSQISFVKFCISLSSKKQFLGHLNSTPLDRVG